VYKSISLSVCKSVSLSVSPYHYRRISRTISALSPSVWSIGQQAIASSSLLYVSGPRCTPLWECDVLCAHYHTHVVHLSRGTSAPYFSHILRKLITPCKLQPTAHLTTVCCTCILLIYPPLQRKSFSIKLNNRTYFAMSLGTRNQRGRFIMCK